MPERYDAKEHYREDMLAPSVIDFSKDSKSWAVYGIEGEKNSPYRYLLGRMLSEARDVPYRRVGFCMLNPSTATHEKDDPTIRKCIGFAKRWGASEILVANCYAFRATDPKKLIHAADPVGPLNENTLQSLAKQCQYVVCAWGAGAGRQGTATASLLTNAGADLRCLGLNKDGSPKHPLYVPYSREVEVFKCRQ